jgi:hypothetical protein
MKMMDILTDFNWPKTVSNMFFFDHSEELLDSIKAGILLLSLRLLCAVSQLI